MLAILSAPGSRGDVNPMIAMGQQLQSRGYEVVISMAEPYVDLAIARGLEAVPLISRRRFNQLLDQPTVWKPIRGARTLLGEVASEFLSLHLDLILERHRPGETVLVSHPFDLASRVFREIEPRTPLFDVHLAPVLLRTHQSPPRMTPWWWEISRPEWAVRLAYGLVDRLAIDPIIAPQLNQVRGRYGLKPVSRILDQWWLSPDRILAMYPHWYAPATDGFSPRLVYCGFPLDPIAHLNGEPDDRSPVLFTSGTANRHSHDFFSRAVDACVRLGRPAILASLCESNFPADLPETVTTASYLSFPDVLPSCVAAVHHGGIGTTSACFASGARQVVRPMAYDQFDNARHVERLRVGRWLRDDSKLASTLEHVIEEEEVGQSVVQLQQRIAGERHGAIVAADEVIRLMK